MPFCVNCGAPNRDGARFCESCGKPIGQVAQGPPPPVQPLRTQTQQAFQSAAKPSTGTAQALTLAALGVYALGAVLAMVGGDVMTMALCVMLVAAIYVGAYMPLQKGDIKTARIGGLVVAAISLLFGFIAIASGGTVAALFDFVAAACIGLGLGTAKA